MKIDIRNYDYYSIEAARFLAKKEDQGYLRSKKCGWNIITSTPVTTTLS